ncbi:MAG: nitrous oxide reductase accessory protein NosL [Chitinophagaceae bacterium]|nr:nitrous oxide reductase accessory protein NosL [Chitinophagaceae bacterium]MCW5929042.1 nitrous oxide reductase accessory protein NosL [Chitinophagaceae bacterium]
MKNKISTLSKFFLILSALMLVVSIFVPIWQIELDAPQYPEGLALQIWANKIAGDVEIINGLNHYIGMKTLHTEDFIEFTILPYLIAGYALLFLLAAIRGTKRFLYIAFAAFVVFGIVAMVDFWIWEYNYGHNLNPDAAIKVPGMAYQPPLIGFKQLLNFGAFSVPHAGGWLFVSAGVLLLVSVLKEAGALKKFIGRKKIAGTVAVFGFLLLLSSCGSKGPEAIRLNVDGCDFCRMKISDGRFGAELITEKGRIYKFDDLNCMVGFCDEQPKGSIKSHYINDYSKDNDLIDATTAWYVYSENLKSPMGGNTAAFASKEEALKAAAGPVLNWSEIVSNVQQHQGDEEQGHH